MRGRGVVVLSVLIVAGLVTWRTTRPTPRPGPGGTLVASATSGTIAVHGSAFTVTGPFRHKNLSVFVLHSEVRDETDFLTLDDGLRDGSVEVSETPEQQVNELLIENRS